MERCARKERKDGALKKPASYSNVSLESPIIPASLFRGYCAAGSHCRRHAKFSFQRAALEATQLRALIDRKPLTMDAFKSGSGELE